ncbi:esterase-like activity of phytase family protein [Polaribacter sp.]|uniref:esterase-like activity of phytase family protein n=1 Tax=Polaribacter sp. TaxID=1920175 RepID=UPI003EF7C4F5
MKNYCFYFLIACLFFSCKNEKRTTLHFLDEYVLADSISFKNTIIGGLSGVDYVNGTYYFAVDDLKNPRFLTAEININNNKIEHIDFKNVFLLKDATKSFYTENAFDLESIFVDEETKEVYFVSEGAINKGKNPLVFSMDVLNNDLYNFEIPSYFKANSISKPKENGTFEGSSKSINSKGFWVAMEAPLKIDGEEPTFTKKSSPVRITYFDKTTKKATKQFAYQLEHITKPAKGNINLNGVTAILEYKENHFFIVERTYQSNYGSKGNIVRIFEAFADTNTTNTLDVKSLKETPFVPLKKRLLLNFEAIKGHLTEEIVDNIEGITFGPKLPNGNQSLLLVSDDNFQMYGPQLNQFIILEIAQK